MACNRKVLGIRLASYLDLKNTMFIYFLVFGPNSGVLRLCTWELLMVSVRGPYSILGINARSATDTQKIT